jgi:large subunit ribosomal protein L4
MVLEDFSFDAPKTKAILDILKGLNVADKKTVLVTPEYEKNVYLSCRNLEKSCVIRAQDLNTYDILHANTLIFAEGSIEKVVAHL